ncbi:MAG: tRNA (adenosine(37)-N6)-dimethylallyltransferase MiaA [Planctomycetes bacterium]|nr:tRNA (adenosine(37)-N6)-dimethylallyltransferase MiaA [Planctomycetota bacterium]MCC7172963.1 tRNA (adenosine(37)-N6)-dimethylallyltransferase MiaA [Planctomycetota bacterium]
MSAAAASIYVLTGPTAAGKKDVGFALARAHGLDVVGMDSVKVYRGLSIGAAAPGAEADGIVLHLVGVADPRERFSVGRWIDDAAAAVDAIRAAGRRPLFLGGTPLYLQALLRGLFEGPPADPVVRERHRVEAEQAGVAALYARLVGIDPDAAARILPTDLKRISRALEVHELTGERISVLQRAGTKPRLPGPFHVVHLTAPRPVLDDRIRERVARMLDRGLVDEVRALQAAGLLRGEAATAIGYREVVERLGQDRLDVDALRSAIETHTRQLVRKQERWFKRFCEIVRVERGPDDDTSSLARAVERAFGLPPHLGSTNASR